MNKPDQARLFESELEQAERRWQDAYDASADAQALGQPLRHRHQAAVHAARSRERELLRRHRLSGRVSRTRAAFTRRCTAAAAGRSAS